MNIRFFFLVGLLLVFGEAFANPIPDTDESYSNAASGSHGREPREVIGEATTLSTGALSEPEPEPESEPEPRSEPEPEPESEPEPAVSNDYISLENSDERYFREQNEKITKGISNGLKSALNGNLEQIMRSHIKQQSKDPEVQKAANSALDSIMKNLKTIAAES